MSSTEQPVGMTSLHVCILDEDMDQLHNQLFKLFNPSLLAVCQLLALGVPVHVNDCIFFSIVSSLKMFIPQRNSRIKKQQQQNNNKMNAVTMESWAQIFVKNKSQIRFVLFEWKRWTMIISFLPLPFIVDTAVCWAKL